MTGKDTVRQISNVASFSGLAGRFFTRAVLGKSLIRDHRSKTHFFTENCSDYARRALLSLGVEIETPGYDRQMLQQKNYLLVSNHLSYIDVLAMASIMPCVFVTSVDLGESGFLGTVAELGGSIFVERRNRSQIEKDIAMLARYLSEGFQVVVYPEGTSTNGESVLPFKRSLFRSAIDAGRDILPVCTQYVAINGEPVSLQNRDQVCWYGDMEFAPHFMGFMKMRSLKIRLSFLEPIAVTPESQRDTLAALAHQRISDCYQHKLAP